MTHTTAVLSARVPYTASTKSRSPVQSALITYVWSTV